MPHTEATHTTTIKAPVSIWAALDQIRAARAQKLGRRPLTCELLLEAISAFIERERRG